MLPKRIAHWSPPVGYQFVAIGEDRREGRWAVVRKGGGTSLRRWSTMNLQRTDEPCLKFSGCLIPIRRGSRRGSLPRGSTGKLPSPLGSRLKDCLFEPVSPVVPTGRRIRLKPGISRSFEELLAALDVVGEPSEFPYADWPGVTVSVIA